MDDEASLTETLGEILRLSGFEVVTASTAERALQEVGERGFDALLCDLNLNGDDGLTVIRAMARQQPRAAILVISGYGEKLRGMPEDVRGVVTQVFPKPTDLGELIAALRRARPAA